MFRAPWVGVFFRADGAFAKPEIYESVEEREAKYAIRLPAKDNLERKIHFSHPTASPNLLHPAGRLSRWRRQHLTPSGKYDAIRIMARPNKGQTDRAAKIIGVSSPALYRWLRPGSMHSALGTDLLSVHDLTDVRLEPFLAADGLPTGAGRAVRRGKRQDLLRIVALRVFTGIR